MKRDHKVSSDFTGNVARGKSVIGEEGVSFRLQEATDGNTRNYDGHNGFAYFRWPGWLTVDLETLRKLKCIRLLLWDGRARDMTLSDRRFYLYRLLVSSDGRSWLCLHDTGLNGSNGWQILNLLGEIEVRYITVHGIFNSKNQLFQIVQLEAYEQPPRDPDTDFRSLQIDVKNAYCESMTPGVAPFLVRSEAYRQVQERSGHDPMKAKCEELKNLLSKCPAGQEAATNYHNLVFKILEMVFQGSLMNPQIEARQAHGTKRVDIVFDKTPESNSFFNELTAHFGVICPWVFFECKNYTGDVGNESIDQLSGRLGAIWGNLGILVCRNVEDQNRLLVRRREILIAKKEVLLVLTDEDLKTLLDFKAEGKDSSINQYLREKLRDLLLPKQ